MAPELFRESEYRLALDSGVPKVLGQCDAEVGKHHEEGLLLSLALRPVEKDQQTLQQVEISLGRKGHLVGEDRSHLVRDGKGLADRGAGASQNTEPEEWFRLLQLSSC